MTWYAKPTWVYSIDSNEAKTNALNIADVLYSQGWTKESICALLGNAQYESGMNPWRWSDPNSLYYVPSFNDFSNWTAAEAQLHGYGLLQYTPANKYINATSANLWPQYFFPNFTDITGQAIDGYAQMLWFAANGAGEWINSVYNYNYYYTPFINYGVNITPWYYTTFNNFINGVDNNGNQLTLAELTGVFELCYERPEASAAASSYQTRVNYAQYYYGIIPNPPQPHTWGKMPWIYYLKRRRY